MHATISPEVSSRVEELETIAAWIDMLAGKSPSEAKQIVIDCYREGFISLAVMNALLNTLKLRGE